MKIPKQIIYSGRTLKKIKNIEAEEMQLKNVGSASAVNLRHAIYLMDKFCKDKNKVEFYSVEWFVAKDFDENSRGVIKFWRKGK